MLRPSALVIRRGAIALAGGACAALCAVILASAARPHLEQVDAAAATRPVIIDGPPTQVEAAPPPPKLTPRRIHRRAEPFTDQDDDYEAVAADAPRAQPEAPQAPMQPPAAAEAAQAGPSGPCDGFAGPADRLVCANPRLNAAEAALQRLYGMALYRTDDPDGLREDQRRWRAVRDQVAEEGGPQGLAEFYAERLQELDGPY